MFFLTNLHNLLIYLIEQEALQTREPTSHTTVRTDRYTAVQPHKCKDS